MALYGNMLTIPQKTSIADGSITTAKLADGAVTGAKMATETILNANYAPASITANKLASDARYWDEVARNNNSRTTITKDWGRLWNYCWGENQAFSMDGTEFANLDTFWSCIIYATTNPVTITLTGMPRIIDTETGKNYGAEHTFIVPGNRVLWLKKISTADMLVGGSFSRPVISYGTTEPTGGNDGDIYIQYVE